MEAWRASVHGVAESDTTELNWTCVFQCRALCLSHPVLPLLCPQSIVYIGSVYFQCSQFIRPSLPFPDCVHKSVLYCVSASALQIGSSVLFFLGPIYMHWYTIFVFLLWLSSFCIIGPRFIHISSADSNSFPLMAQFLKKISSWFVAVPRLNLSIVSRLVS